MHSKYYYKLLKEENINSCDKKKLVDIKAVTDVWCQEKWAKTLVPIILFV